MATRKQTIVISHPVQPQQRGAAVPVGKQKIATGAQRKTRQALGDIGNLVDGRVQTQINRPITRRFGAQLLAQAAAAAEANKKPATVPVNGVAAAKAGAKAEKKVITVLVNGAAAKGGAKAEKKVLVKKKVEKVIEISSETDEQVKNESANIPCSSKSSRKTVHTLTSVLTARSKAACGITDKPKELLAHDIDTADAEDQLAVVEYIEDIYKFYKHAEHSSRPHDYMDFQIEINARMRAILVDWLIDVHHKFELTPETLYLTFHIIDRYLSMETVTRRELQLVGVSAMLIASKYEEIWAPQVNDFVCISDRAYSGEQVLVMEKRILNKLEWNLTVPTPYVFLVRFLKAAISDTEMEHMVFFLAELGLMQYSLMIMYCPSMVAASAVYAARCTLKKTPLWTETLKCHTGYSEEQLLDCAEIIVNSHSAAPESKLKVVFNKYSSELFGSVARHPPATKILADLKASRK